MGLLSRAMPLGLSWGWTEFSTFDHETSLVSAAAFLAFHIIVIVWFVRLLTCTRVDDALSSQWTKVQYMSSAVLLMLAIELPVLLSTPNEGLMDLIQGTDPKLSEILARVPAIQQGPSPPLILRNRHMQFIPWMIQNEIHRRFSSIPFQRINVEVSDCANKMEGCHIPHMNDTIALDIFPPFHDSIYTNKFNKSSPIILFAPGLRCHSQDLPGNSIIRKAFESGFRSIVVNRRGLVQQLKSPRLNIFGDVDDLEQIYFYIKRELVSSDCPLFLHGISAGTAVTVSALSKWDKRRIDQPDRETPVFVASIDVVPGYDISKALNRERFLWPYNDLLMQGVKDHFVLQNEELLRRHDSDAVDRMLGASSLQEVVDAGVIFAGYANTTSYYQDTNPINEVRHITTPKLVINAADDPCCNIANLYEQSPYPQHEGKTFAQMIRETERGMVAVTYTGSHAPFVCTRNRWLPFVNDPLTGGWMLNSSWADQVAMARGDRKFL
mmetsp:Transcript_11350/g.24931  ORF Transcript_11350/g.24931 Transcript_11350/m.24931 type:complete len:495 (-) Transcript_11350:1310-2794(-)